MLPTPPKQRRRVGHAAFKHCSSALLSFDALPGTEIPGTVTKVDTIGTVSQGVVTYNVEIEPQSLPQALKPGMSGNATITLETKPNALLVPSSAVRSDASGTYVFIPGGDSARLSLTDDNTATDTEYRRVPVIVGLTDNVSIEIISGLMEGDLIITKLPEIESTNTSATTSQRSLLPFGPGGQRSR